MREVRFGHRWRGQLFGGVRWLAVDRLVLIYWLVRMAVMRRSVRVTVVRRRVFPLAFHPIAAAAAPATSASPSFAVTRLLVSVRGDGVAVLRREIVGSHFSGYFAASLGV